MAEAGLNLVLVARRGDVLNALAAQLQTHGIQTLVVAADLTHPEGVKQVTQVAHDLDLGLLVAAAGFGSSGPFLQTDLMQELEMLDVNCKAVLSLTHHFAHSFAAQQRGGLVLMSSLVGFQGVPGTANYAATKGYIQTLAEGLHAELAPYGVDVLASAPGPVHSGFAERANMRMGFALTSQEVARTTLLALGRRGTVRPGRLSVLLEASLALLPRWARTRIMAWVMGNMTRHQT
ncbi:SDR family NAD(P)-dependent oxidoreductase [Deinococcus sp. Arct2-2]|uniref:SDR family NAD(P)-dependent oxidoreductase n=1 Tax=Deinococcus sp. Arct2-2 TaxID=2568653 RepID=UPI00197ABB2D|nr:SDR family NAD(P)-dependent oxidoreductase [Deinococcus sp. Arct2-2]